MVEYIIFGEYQNFFNKFIKTFGDDLKVIILLPSEDETISRDRERECWTTGAERIKVVREEFLEIKDFIGKDNFIDSSDQTPEETIAEILN